MPQSEEQFHYDRFEDETKEDADEERKATTEVKEMPDISACYRQDTIKDSTKKMGR